jgi:hypothetical protein
MNTCANCIHWRTVDIGSGKSVRGVDGTVKNCTALPPRTDFHWPRTEERHTCGMWSDGKASGEGLEAKGRTPAADGSPVQAQVAALVDKIEAGKSVTIAEAVQAFVAPPPKKRGQAKAEPTQKEML